MFTKLYSKMLSAKTAFINKMRDEKGSHVVEVVIFIGIAVILLAIFRKEVTNMINNIFKGANDVISNNSTP